MSKKSVLGSAAAARYSEGFDYSNLIAPEAPKEIKVQVEETTTEPRKVKLEAVTEEPKAAKKPRAKKQPKAEAEGARYKMVELRTKRVQLVMQPSVYEALEEKRKKKGYKSFNDLVHTILEQYTKEN